jgi:hypothetical protein
MPLPAELEPITGARELYDWFGFWPSFHDPEVIKLHLNRRGPSCLAIHTWEMTKRVDSKGYYELEKHVVVEFILEDVAALSLEGFSKQNVIFGLAIDKIETGFPLTLDPCYGLSGTIEARSVSIHITPGPPALSS